MSRRIYIDPSYDRFNSDRLFDLDDPTLNRDGQLLPFHRLRDTMARRDISVHTADRLPCAGESHDEPADYYSLGIVSKFEAIQRAGSARLAAFVVMEPPVVAPEIYASLPRLTELFSEVYVHNIEGDGYAVEGVDTGRLRKLYWPIPHADVLATHWEHRPRERRVVVINGNHRPRARAREQYSVRIEAMAELARHCAVDLYGTGWQRWWSRTAMWAPYWRHRGAIKAIYKGACSSKFDVLQNYDFCLCFENMSMKGYITEKIFDCFYAGAIPLYLGAPDVADYIAADSFIDARSYPTWTDMWRHVVAMPPDKVAALRDAGREFLRSPAARNFYDSMQNVCGR